jgi:hypothetical protein
MANEAEGRQTDIWRRFGEWKVQDGFEVPEDIKTLPVTPLKSSFYRDHPGVGVLVLDALQHCRGVS